MADPDEEIDSPPSLTSECKMEPLSRSKRKFRVNECTTINTAQGCKWSPLPL